MKLITPEDLMNQKCDVEFQHLHHTQNIGNWVLFWIGMSFLLITLINIAQITINFKIIYSYIDPPLTGIGAFVLLFLAWRNFRTNQQIYNKICNDNQ